MFFDEPEKKRVRGKVAVAGNALDNLLVEFIVEITPVFADVKKSKRAEPARLMYLEIEYQIFFSGDGLW